MTQNALPKPKRIDSAGTGRSGVHHVGGVIEDELNWVFREQPDGDYGIDAHVETVVNESVTGKLLALQIKSSRKQFKKRPRAKGWWFFPKNTHVNYWIDHALPVVIVLYDRESKTAYWQSVSKDTLKPVKKTRKTDTKPDAPVWRIFVPEDQVVGAVSKEAFARLADGDPYILRLRRLRLAKPWMDLLRSGRRILFDVDEWIHKTSGRGSFMLRSVDDANEDSRDLGEWSVLLGRRSYEEVLPELFPWGDVHIHEETYDDAEYEQYRQECVTFDENDEYFSMEFEDWRSLYRSDVLRPYQEDGSGEVERWRLEISLNKIGEAFLLIDEFANGETQFLLPNE